MADTSPPTGRPDDPGIVVGVVAPDALAKAVRRAVTRALAEDLGDRGDLTSRATVPAGMTAEAEIVARQAGWISGLDAVVETFAAVDARITVDLHVANGDHVIADQVVATISGPARGILAGERTALNFLGRLSGIATATADLQDLLEGTGCTVRDTRKTTPGLRLLEKAAVADGGGGNHRIGLYDAVLVKENHVLAAGGIDGAVAALRASNPDVAIQVEVDDLDQLARLIDLGVGDILLDNFTVEEVRHAAARVDGRANLEVSGNLDASSIRAYAEAVGPGGRLAVGAITHSAPSLDVALDVVSTEHAVPLVRPHAVVPSTTSSSVDDGAPDVGAPDVGASDVGGPVDGVPVGEASAESQVELDSAEERGAGASRQDVSDAVASDEPSPDPVGEVSADPLGKAPLRKRVSSFFGRDDSDDSAEPESSPESESEDSDEELVDLTAGVAGGLFAGSAEPATAEETDLDLAALAPPTGAPVAPSDEYLDPDPDAVVADAVDSDAVVADTVVPGALDSDAVDSDAVDSGAVDSGAVDSGAVDSGAVDSDAVDSDAVDTGAEDVSGEDEPAAETPEPATDDLPDEADQSEDVQGAGGGEDVEPFERREIAPLFGAPDGATDYTSVEARGEPFSWRAPREG